MLDHPLISRRSIHDIEIKRRPRFTTSEAIILNALVNADGQPVALGRLRELVSAFSYGYPTEASVKQHVGSLRAKLGETKFHPTQILSEVNDAGRVVGYRWVEDL